MAILIFMGGCSETTFDEIDDALLKSAPLVENSWNLYSTWEGDIEACDTYTMCLVAGQHIDVGTLDFAYDNDGNIYVTYHTTGGWYLTEVHLVFGHDMADIPTNKNNHPKIGHFPYKMTFDAGDMISGHTVMIENPHIGTVNQYGCKPAVLAAHAVVVHEFKGEETAWAQVCDDTPQRFVNKGTWATYVSGELCIKPCEVDYSFAWEDLLNEGNDMDYNDLVIQAIVWKELDDGIKTHMKFIAKARGAGYDHAFWLDLGGGNTEMVFESSKMALPGTENGFAHNTIYPCNPLPFAETMVVLDGDFTDPLSFMPMITVYPSGSYLDHTGSYELNIWELAELASPGSGHTFVSADLNYPNGLLIPSDWKWPLEYTSIHISYTDFMDVDHWDDDWYMNLSDPTTVWDPENAVCD